MIVTSRQAIMLLPPPTEKKIPPNRGRILLLSVRGRAGGKGRLQFKALEWIDKAGMLLAFHWRQFFCRNTTAYAPY
jgi:hypothetical protein